MIRTRCLSRFLHVLPLLLATAFLVGCATEGGQSTFDAAGPVAQMQLDLFMVVLWAAVFVFVVVEGALLFTILRFRKRAGGRPPSQVHGNTRLEIAWTIAPAIILLIIAIPTITTVFAVANPPSTPEIEVDVIGHQWWWEFRYPDEGIVTANELHIPVGKVVKLNLASADVIHSFWVPKLAGKVDVIPGRANTMWIQAERIESFLGQCAEFCGLAHAQMGLRVIAESEDTFEAWVLAQKTIPGQATGQAKRGADLFVNKGCAACHTIEGTAARGRVGPDLTHVGSRTTLAAGILDNTFTQQMGSKLTIIEDKSQENLTAWLRNPQAVKPGNKMPNLGLSDEEITALVAYLQALK